MGPGRKVSQRNIGLSSFPDDLAVLLTCHFLGMRSVL